MLREKTCKACARRKCRLLYHAVRVGDIIPSLGSSGFLAPTRAIRSDPISRRTALC